MTPKEARDRNIAYLIQNAEESLKSAEAEQAAGRNRFAMSRVYDACFLHGKCGLVE